jgi:hypothetical protein
MLPRRLRALALMITALALSSVATACSSTRPTGDDPGQPRQLSCPATFVGTAPWVPDRPRGIDGDSRLAPQQPPDRAVICAYRLSPANPGANESLLKGSRELNGTLDALAADLTWLPRQLPGSGYACAVMGTGLYLMNYLIALTYPTGTEWVSSTDDQGGCTTTSNGRFTSPLNIGPYVTAAYRSARWTPIRPHNPSTDNDPCTRWPVGRLGQERQLIPGTPTSILVCSSISGSQASLRTTTLSHGYQHLVDALNALPTKPTQSGCQGDGRQSIYYQLLVHYAQRPDVLLNLDPHCTPAIDNGSLQASDASSITPILEQLAPR